MDLIQLLNITLHNLTQADLLHKLHPDRGGGVVVTPNVDHLMKLQRDAEFYRLYQAADYRVCDSQILFYFSRILGTPIREKIGLLSPLWPGSGGAAVSPRGLTRYPRASPGQDQC